MSWLQEELSKQSEHKDTGYFKLKDGKNVLLVSIASKPVERFVDMDGKKRKYHDYQLLDNEFLGMVFSATDFLHSCIVKELSEYADKECTAALLEIRVEHPTPTKTSYVVIAREVK
jgi:hypothetical protein